MTAGPTGSTQSKDWTRLAERGTARTLQFGAWMAARLPRRPMQVLLWSVAVYFYVANRTARRGSRQYLERLWTSPEGKAALGRKPGALAVLRHIHSFAVSLYDRVLLFGGALDDFRAEHDGSDQIFELVKQGRGAVLLGAHHGSFEQLWLLSREYELPVNVVAFHQNSKHMSQFLESIDPKARVGVISVDPTSVNAAFELKACIDRGEVVVILADRLGPYEKRAEKMTFLGRPAAFPLGPFLLAGSLGCPVLMALCLRTGESRYRTVLRPLRDTGRIARTERGKAARELMAQYIGVLETYCHAFPYEWFNYYEFWDGGASEA